MEKRKIGVALIYVLAVAITIFIIFQSCLDGINSTSQSGTIVNIAKAIINFFNHDAINEDNIDQFSGVIRKLVGHFGLFFIDGIFVTLSLYIYLNNKDWNRKPFFILFSLVFGLFLAFLTENIQTLLPGRSGELRDSMIDFSGYVLSSLIVSLCILFIIRKKNRYNSTEGR